MYSYNNKVNVYNRTVGFSCILIFWTINFINTHITIYLLEVHGRTISVNCCFSYVKFRGRFESSMRSGRGWPARHPRGQRKDWVIITNAQPPRAENSPQSNSSYLWRLRSLCPEFFVLRSADDEMMARFSILPLSAFVDLSSSSRMSFCKRSPAAFVKLALTS